MWLHKRISHRKRAGCQIQRPGCHVWRGLLPCLEVPGFQAITIWVVPQIRGTFKGGYRAFIGAILGYIGIYRV